MEELLSEFSGTLSVEQPNACVTDSSVNPRLLLYKNSGYAMDQQRRWRSELTNLRRQERRAEQVDRNRAMQEFVETDNHPWKHKIRKTRQDRLMQAEWFLFKPQDFANEYLFKLCPKGRHVFVVASKGQTNIYARSGACLATMLTRIPGGGLGESSTQMHRNYTMLDCIMIGTPTAKKTHKMSTDSDVPIVFKILDFVAIKSVVYARNPFVERCQWLESFHREQIESYEPGDVARFEVISVNKCDDETINKIFAEPPPFALDGVLFYHKDVGYRRGPTPLVGWLKPYMLAEWFPTAAYHTDYACDMPMDYRDYLTEIKEFRKEREMRRKAKKKKSNGRANGTCPPKDESNLSGQATIKMDQDKEGSCIHEEMEDDLDN